MIPIFSDEVDISVVPDTHCFSKQLQELDNI